MPSGRIDGVAHGARCAWDGALEAIVAAAALRDLDGERRRARGGGVPGGALASIGEPGHRRARRLIWLPTAGAIAPAPTRPLTVAVSRVLSGADPSLSSRP